MNEITPEMIAQIATRLYNEIPGVATFRRPRRMLPTPCLRQPRLAGRFAAMSPSAFAVAWAPEAAPRELPRRRPSAVADGLAAFVQGIRDGAVPLGRRPLRRRARPATLIRRLVARKVVPVGRVARPSTCRPSAAISPSCTSRSTASRWPGWTTPPRRRSRRA